MNVAHTQQQILRAPHLRAALPAAEAALRILSVGELDASTLALVIGADPVLTAAIVRATEPCAENASVAQRIASLSPARLQSALFPILSDAFTDDAAIGGDNTRWKRTLATAIAAESIARATHSVSPEQAYLAGLMHHCGAHSTGDNDVLPEAMRAIARTYRFPEWLRECMFEGIADTGWPSTREVNGDLPLIVQIANAFAAGASPDDAGDIAGESIGVSIGALIAAHSDYAASFARRLSLFSFTPAPAADLRASLMRFANQLLLNWRVDEGAALNARERAAQLDALFQFHQASRRSVSIEEITLQCAETLRNALGADAGMLSVWTRQWNGARGVTWRGRTAPFETLALPEGCSGVQAMQQIVADPFWQVLDGAPCALPVRTPTNRVTGYIAILMTAGESTGWLARLDDWTRALGAAIENAEEQERQRQNTDALRRALHEKREHASTEPVPSVETARPVDREAVVAGQRNLARAVVAALQSPLSAITAQTGQLTSQTGRATDSALLDNLAKHARGAARVLNDVQALAHAGNGSRDAVLVNAPLRQFLNSVRPRLGRRSIQLEDRLAEGLPRVPLDARKLHHILLNLFAYIEPRLGPAGRHILVSSEVTSGREGVSITIDVTGLPLTGDQAEHLFDPLERYDESASEHALLLAACGAMVREFGGLITACPQVSGTMFILAFESVWGNSAQEVEAPAAPPAQETRIDKHEANRVLVVDDDDGVREILAQALRRCGYEAELAKDGIDALRAMESKPYDLVLLDMLMPNRDGLAVLRELRGKPGAPPVIVMTGSAASGVREEASELGAHSFLQKPFELRTLLAEVESVLVHHGG
ncbi:MAG: response regulator [Candidatus Hydrogenedentes bacterium]|nr:response regulator [Candidatus Hydrogenedentota bacterium]